MQRHPRILLSLVMLISTGCENAPTTPPAQLASEQVAPAAQSVDGPVTSTAAGALEFVAPPLTAEEIQAGWISLFDGRTLFGWDVPTVTNWHVEDGAIVADSGDKSLLLTPFHFDDFELRCSFHVAEGGNSGIFLRTAAFVCSSLMRIPRSS